MFDFKFDWRPDLDLHISTIDMQHRQLFEMGRDMEQLLRVQCIGVTDKQQLDIVCRLRDYTGYHFYAEEKLMEDTGYPNLAKHHAEHSAFTDKVMKINLPKLQKEPQKELQIIKDLVQDWIFAHLLHEDQEMAKYLLTHGVDNDGSLTPKQEQQEIQEVNDILDETYGLFICKMNATNIYLSMDQSNKGRVTVVYIKKVKDFSTLTALERNNFFEEVSKVARVIRKVFNPQALEYAFMGDVDERLHFHIVPKYKETDNWGVPFLSTLSDERLEMADYHQIAEQIREKLR